MLNNFIDEHSKEKCSQPTFKNLKFQLEFIGLQIEDSKSSGPQLLDLNSWTEFSKLVDCTRTVRSLNARSSIKTVSKLILSFQGNIEFVHQMVGPAFAPIYISNNLTISILQVEFTFFKLF